MSISLYALEKETGINRGTISRKLKSAGIDTGNIQESDLETVYQVLGFDPNSVEAEIVEPSVSNGLVKTETSAPNLYIGSLTINLQCTQADTQALNNQTGQIEAVNEQLKGMIVNSQLSVAGAKAENLKAQTDNFLAQLGLATSQEIAKKLGLTQEQES